MSVASEHSVLIVGAGPCGLACARELTRLGHEDWLILEREAEPGGLARSVRDRAGFTWDLGGHVVFSHFGEFDSLLAETMGDEVLVHDRSSYIRWEERWIPYPFQNHLRHLPPEIRDRCLEDLRDAPGAPSDADFATWMRATFGAGITEQFLGPYNLKVWAHPPASMSAGWIAERVARVDYERARRNVREGRDEPAWGPNSRFVFPAAGGTGEIYRRVAAPLAARIDYGTEVVAVDAGARQVRLADGRTLAYRELVSTMPLDRLVEGLVGAPTELRRAAEGLVHNSVYMVGVGYEAPLTDERSWLYFPQPELPFYRVTNFAKYAAANVPDGDSGRYCSYMTESATSALRPLRREGLEDRVEAGLRAAGVIGGRPPVASAHVERIEYAYPVPTLDRDAALAQIQPWLAARGILSRGRFGTWCYEIGNMDHAVKMGVDAARRIASGEPEELWPLAPADAAPVNR